MKRRFEEYGVEELGRLMVMAHDLENAVDELNPLSPTADETEDLHDARYYARKLRVIISRLAVTAEREYREAEVKE